VMDCFQIDSESMKDLPVSFKSIFEEMDAIANQDRKLMVTIRFEL
jgi:hypothetical protein